MDWKRIIGETKELRSNILRNNMAKAWYLVVLKCIEDIKETSGREIADAHVYETLHMAMNPPPEGKKKYTYLGTKKTKDKATGKERIEKNVELPVKKYVNIRADFKFGLECVLNMYVKECIAFFQSRNKTLPEDSTLFSDLCDFASQNYNPSISPMIIRLPDVIPADARVSSPYGDVSGDIAKKIKDRFKMSDNRSPRELNKLTEAFARFIDCFAIISADLLWEKKTLVNSVFFLQVFRIFHTLMQRQEVDIDSEIFSQLESYMEQNTPRKTTTTKAKSEEGEDEEEETEENGEQEESEEAEESEEGTPKKKTTPKKTTPKKPTPKKTTPKKKVTKAEENEENTAALDEALNEDEQWSESKIDEDEE